MICAPLFAEGARYTTLLPWRTGVSLMLARIADTSNAGTVLLGIPPLLGSQPLAIMARWRARRIEQVLRGVSEQTPKTLVVPTPAITLDALAETAGPEVYADTACAALPAMLELLGIRTLRGTSSVAAAPGAELCTEVLT